MPTTKQIGDACEMLVAAHLTLAGLPAVLMPDNWPDYDLIAQPLDGLPQRISVKARCQSPRDTSTHTFHFDPTGCDWIAFVFLPKIELSKTEATQTWIVPADVARESSLPDRDGRRLPLARLRTTLATWEGNFTLARELPKADHL